MPDQCRLESIHAMRREADSGGRAPSPPPGTSGIRHERAEQIKNWARRLVCLDVGDRWARHVVIARSIEAVAIDRSATAPRHGIEQEGAECAAVTVAATEGQNRHLAL